MFRSILCSLILVAVTACGSKRDPQIELIQDMMDQPSYKTQDFDESGKGGRSMRLPPDGSVPIGHKPYTIKDSQTAESVLKNPVQVSAESLIRGQKMYYTYCFVCHGSTGRGDGPVAEKTMAKPPSLVNARIKGWKDGGIYHLITSGRGLMGSFASQIPDEKDRWALVNFVRRLQENAE